MEASFTTVVDTRGAGALRVHGPSTPLMLPIYGLAQPLFEPLHDAVRGRPAWQRGVAYAAGALATEAACGLLLRGLTGSCPWDYTGRSRFSIGGVVRLDYGPLWALAGLAAERVDDRMRAGRRSFGRPREPRRTAPRSADGTPRGALGSRRVRCAPRARWDPDARPGAGRR
jgi:hypothetical protein